MGEHTVDGEVEQDIEDGAGANADNQRAGEVLAGVLDLLGNRVGVGPALIGPQGCHGRKGDHADDAADAAVVLRRNQAQVRGLPPHDQRTDDDDGDGDQLGHQGHILQKRPQPDAKAVIGRQDDDQGDGNEFDRGLGEAEIPLQSRRQGNGHCGDGTCAAEQPAGKTEHIAYHGMIRLVKVHHHAACRRVAGAQLGKAQSAQDGHQSAHNPAQKGQAHAHVGALQNVGAQVENARAYHNSGDDADASK